MYLARMEDDPKDVIVEALGDLGRRNAIVANLIDEHGPYEPRATPAPDVFGALAKSIIYQQLAGKAAATIHGRFRDLFEGPLTAEEALGIPVDAIRAAGLSKAKCKAVLDLAQFVVDGKLDAEELQGLDDDALVLSLCRVRGIGPWTAQMFLIFELGRLDVWPSADLGVRKGFCIAFGGVEVPTPRAMESLGEPFRPYRSIVAWYCWRVLDAPRPSADDPPG